MDPANRFDLFELICLVVLVAFVYLVVRLFFKNKSDPLGIDGKLVWIDRGHSTKPFFNKQFRVFGKPDLMYRLRSGGILAVEYKSRRGRIYKSDLAQTQAAALAARGAGFAVREILIKTNATEQRCVLPRADEALFAEIQRYADCVREAKAGAKLPLPPRPQAGKCRTCAFGPRCSSAV